MTGQPAAARAFTGSEIKKRCKLLRQQIVDYKLASDEECATYWPGGAENPYRGYDGFIWCFAQFTRLCGRDEEATKRQDSEHMEGMLAEAVAAAAAATPVAVDCSDGETRNVYPKSYVALELLEGLAAVVERTRAIAARALVDMGDGVTDDVALQTLLPVTRSRAVCVWAWVITTEGPGFPWDGDAEAVEPPQWTAALAPEDLLALHHAHQTVNRSRLSIMAAAFPADPGERSRLGLGGMLASYAHEKGRPPREVMRLLSVGEAVAGAIASYETGEVARRNADARAKEQAR